MAMAMAHSNDVSNSVTEPCPEEGGGHDPLQKESGGTVRAYCCEHVPGKDRTGQDRTRQDRAGRGTVTGTGTGDRGPGTGEAGQGGTIEGLHDDPRHFMLIGSLDRVLSPFIMIRTCCLFVEPMSTKTTRMTSQGPTTLTFPSYSSTFTTREDWSPCDHTPAVMKRMSMHDERQPDGTCSDT